MLGNVVGEVGGLLIKNIDGKNYDFKVKSGL